MKLNATKWMAIACALLPLSAPGAEEKVRPLWEIQARLDGATSPAFSRSVREMLGSENVERVLSGHTVLRAAGFVNPQTPEGDWIAEMSGMRGIDEILQKDQPEAGFTAWSEDAGTLKLAGPATNKGQSLEEMIQLKGDVWLSGWIDLAQLEDSDIESQLLKLPENLSFTLAGTGDVVAVELRATLRSPETAKALSRWLEDFQNLLKSLNATAMIPTFVCEAEGAAVILRMNFQEQHLEDLLDRIKEMVTKPEEKNPSDSDR